MRAAVRLLIALFLLGGSAFAAEIDPEGSAAAVDKLRASLNADAAQLAEIARLEFASTPLTKDDAEIARELIWQAHAAVIRKERAAEIQERVLTDGDLKMPFDFKPFGEKPKTGRSLWISLHGGGEAPKEVNDQQWENQKRLYKLEEGIYLAPRAPTDTWNLWHQGHIDTLFGRLIEDLIVLKDVDPDRVYVLGYSAGGDGVYQIGPRLADTWAGAAMMAGHPNGVSLLSLRNVAFALQVGGNDAAFNRNKVGREYGDALEKLQQDDPAGYANFVRIHEGKGHWMDFEDAAALPWMAKFSRNPIPDRVVWKQSGVPHERSYWLAVPKDQANGSSLVIARRDSQTIVIDSADQIDTLLVRLDDRMVDLDKPVTIRFADRVLYSDVPVRTAAVLLKTLIGRGDPKLMFSSEISVELKTKP